MFNDKKKTGNGNGISKQPNHLGQTSFIKGEIESKEDFRIDGKMEGNFSTTGKLVVGEKGELNGTVKANQAEIQGKITGDLIVSDLLTIRKTAHIEGNVKTGKLAIESGAIFNATCEMTTTTTAKASAKKV